MKMLYNSNNNNSKLKGGFWEYVVYFTGDAENPGESPQEIFHNQLLDFSYNVEGRDEIITAVYRCTNNLNRGVPKLCNLWHEFLVIRTTNNWWWSFEKGLDCIRVQRSKTWESVLTKYRGVERPGVLFSVHNKDTIHIPRRRPEHNFCRRPRIRDIFKMIHTGKYINEKYNILSSNCQDFSENISRGLAQCTVCECRNLGHKLRFDGFEIWCESCENTELRGNPIWHQSDASQCVISTGSAKKTYHQLIATAREELRSDPRAIKFLEYDSSIIQQPFRPLTENSLELGVMEWKSNSILTPDFSRLLLRVLMFHFILVITLSIL